MLQRIVLVLLHVGLVTTAFSQPAANSTETEVVAADTNTANTADAMGFLRVRAIRGPDWEIEKVKNPEGLWLAELRSRGATVMEFGDCGEREDWMRFMLWPVEAPDPDLLFVLRYAGGAHGPDALDVISLKVNFRSLFHSVGEFNFNLVKDLDNDGWPEIVGVSRHYAYLFDLPWEQSPFPTVVFSYRADAKKYMCQNHRFTSVLSEKADRYRKAFESSPATKDTYKYDRWNEESRRALSSLVAWTLEMCYMGQSNAAWAYLREFTTPETYNLVHPMITEKLATEPYYQELERVEQRDAAGGG